MAATVEIAGVVGGVVARVEIVYVGAGPTIGGSAYVQIAGVGAVLPSAAPAKVELVGINGFFRERFNGETLWRERVDGVWQVPAWTMMSRVAGSWVPS